jgi:hypothetical protein
MIIDAASERSEQGRFLSNGTGSRNAVLGVKERESPNRGKSSSQGSLSLPGDAELSRLSEGPH